MSSTNTNAKKTGRLFRNVILAGAVAGGAWLGINILLGRDVYGNPMPTPTNSTNPTGTLPTGTQPTGTQPTGPTPAPTGTLTINAFVTGTDTPLNAPFVATVGSIGPSSLQTPQTFNVSNGVNYSVRMDNFAGFTFSNWGNQSTNPLRTGTLDLGATGAITFTAFYVPVGGGQTTITVNAQTQAGGALNMFTVLMDSAGSQLATGFTPMQFPVNVNQAYQVQVQNFETHNFVNWTDGNTQQTRAVTPSGPTTLTAVFTG